MIVASEAENFAFIVEMSSNEKKMKKQHKVFSVDEKMHIEENTCSSSMWRTCTSDVHEALHIEASRKMWTNNSIGLVKKNNLILFWFCKLLLFHELYL